MSDHGVSLVRGPVNSHHPDTALSLVAKAAAERPDGEAVRSATQSVSYSQLWARSEALARRLLHSGIGAGQHIGLHAERSVDLIVAILGVLRAGAVCVPLDVGYPVERLHFMCADADIHAVVGHPQLLPRLGELQPVCHEGPLTLAVRPKARREDHGGAGADLPRLAPGDLAYILYTSGSTGRPKGVMYEHGNLANLVSWQIRDSRCGAGDRTLQFSPASFSIIFQETFTTLGAGGTLVCCSEDERLDPGLLWELIAREQINRIFVPFVTIQSLALYADEISVAKHPLREVLTAGEQVQSSRRVKAMFAVLADCRLVNQWGTTETHISARHVLPEDPLSWPVLPPIGTPVGGAHVHVMGNEGEPGELWIAGAGVGRGYLGLPERTAENYVPDPCDPTVRAYRTGDLGRVNEQGELEFLGRKDTQVKVRGFRVELGEIETLLNSLPGVAESVVAVAGTDAGDRYLQAFVVAASETVQRDELFAALTRSLPSYMVPSRIEMIPALPRTPSGKLDRLSLVRP